MKAFIVSGDYDIVDDKTLIFLFGRLENGQSFISSHTLKPYFFIKKSDVKKASRLLEKYEVEDTNLVNFQGDKVSKISHSITTELNKLIKALKTKEIDTYEDDVKPYSRFIIDNNILGSINIEGHYETSDKVDRVYSNPEIKPADFKPELKIISIDIESDKHSDKLFCIGLYGKDYKKNFIVTDESLKNAISCKTEEECLEKFKQEIIKLDPDIITGWNLIDFDLKFLKEKFSKHKIKFDIGRDDKEPRLKIESEYFKNSSAKISGRQVLDAMYLIQDPFIKEAPSIKDISLESYTLEDVSQAILGQGKLIKGKKRHDEIERLYKSDRQKLVDYNLMDCKLVYDILDKTKMIDLAIERSQLTGLNMDRATASIAAFDSLYIREARKKGFVSPSTRFSSKEERIKGGYVQDAVPGIYKNVLVLDFKSLYPSIIKTFNIDPASQLEKKEKNSIESPNKAYFKDSEGVLPVIIEKLHQAREKAKKEKRELSSYAIKIIMNSFFGVLASPNCRYFSLEMANAITHFGQFIIKLTAKEIEKKGHKVIYSDTDSCFVETNLEKHKANQLGKELPEYINNFYNKYVKENYNRKSYLELQFDKQFIYLLIPRIRNQKEEESVGAKKRYAGLVEKEGKEEIQVVGMEAIRGDWVEAARDFQRELLNKVFHNEPVEQFIKDYIKKIKSGKLDDKLIYRKSIRKSLEEYTKTTPPHVKAARQLDFLESNVIQYYITTEGPEPIQKLRHKIDYDHYIKKQIEPLANQVLLLLNKDFESIEKNSKQSKLF